jgi:16S rRNA processing protein RimM
LARRLPERNLIALGRVAGSYGVRGWIRVAEASEALAGQASWNVGGAEYAVEETKPHSGALLAKLAGIEDREQARRLKGKTVSLPRERLPEPAQGTYYWSDLVGLEVVNVQGLVLGVVTEMFTNGAHDVAELAGDRKRLLPWVPAVVKKVDLVDRRIEVDWGADW